MAPHAHVRGSTDQLTALDGPTAAAFGAAPANRFHQVSLTDASTCLPPERRRRPQAWSDWLSASGSITRVTVVGQGALQGSNRWT